VSACAENLSPSYAPRVTASLVFPLLRLEGETEPAPEPTQEPVARTLDLDGSADLTAWVTRVREAPETCLVLDAEGRIAGLSASGAALLGLDPVRSVGALLLAVIELADGSDPEPLPPPLRTLATGRLTRGLVRLRNSGAKLTTYDVVGVPLAAGTGALAFFSQV
jgi:hypothetical protein